MKPMLLRTLLSCLVQPGHFLSHSRLRKQQTSSEDGLTLLECLVAIAVIALTGAMIGPPLVLAAATRVQNRRAEQSLQLAQGEVDRIRAMVITNSASVDLLPDLVTVNDLETHPAPTARLGNVLRSPDTSAGCGNYDPTDPNHVPSNSEVLAIDIDGQADNCEADFLIQAFRQNLDRAGETRDFQLMVRVYAAKAEDNFGNLAEEQAGLGFTSGDGDYWQRPLAVLTTRVNESDNETALCGYHGLNTQVNPDGSEDTDC